MSTNGSQAVAAAPVGRVIGAAGAVGMPGVQVQRQAAQPVQNVTPEQFEAKKKEIRDIHSRIDRMEGQAEAARIQLNELMAKYKCKNIEELRALHAEYEAAARALLDEVQAYVDEVTPKLNEADRLLAG